MKVFCTSIVLACSSVAVPATFCRRLSASPSPSLVLNQCDGCLEDCVGLMSQLRGLPAKHYTVWGTIFHTVPCSCWNHTCKSCQVGIILRDLSSFYKTYRLLTKSAVKMAGYCPSSFFEYLWIRTESRSINSQKQERGQHPATLTEQAWSIKDLIMWLWGKFFWGTWRVVPSGQDSSTLPARVANHSARFDSPCPISELAI